MMEICPRINNCVKVNAYSKLQLDFDYISRYIKGYKEGYIKEVCLDTLYILTEQEYKYILNCDCKYLMSHTTELYKIVSAILEINHIITTELTEEFYINYQVFF